MQKISSFYFKRLCKIAAVPAAPSKTDYKSKVKGRDVSYSTIKPDGFVDPSSIRGDGFANDDMVPLAGTLQNMRDLAATRVRDPKDNKPTSQANWDKFRNKMLQYQRQVAQNSHTPQELYDDRMYESPTSNVPVPIASDPVTPGYRTPDVRQAYPYTHPRRIAAMRPGDTIHRGGPVVNEPTN